MHSSWLQPESKTLKFYFHETICKNKHCTFISCNIRCMLSLFDHNFERSIDTNTDTMVTEMAKYSHQILGAGADGASVNMGWKNKLLTKRDDWKFQYQGIRYCDMKSNNFRGIIYKENLTNNRFAFWQWKKILKATNLEKMW